MNNILISILLVAGFIIAVFVRSDGDSPDVRFFNATALTIGCAMIIGGFIWKLKDR